jgi:hypothetical protein
VASAVDIKWSQYIPHVPTPKQHAFLWLDVKEAFFGGSAGGGKSDALLMAALQYVDVPGYAAVLFRRTYTDLALPGAIMSRAQEWLAGTDAKWNDNEKKFTFPSGASINFSYLKGPNDRFRYQSAEFQFVGFDELTHFPEEDYTYLMSRLRKPSSGPLSLVPLRARGAANPGGVGHVWVKKRFVDGRSPDRVFIPAGLEDNPHLDQETYEQSLALLDPITHAQLRHGDWHIRPPGLWTFDHTHVEAALELGDYYDRLLTYSQKHGWGGPYGVDSANLMPPPMHQRMLSGTDFGDFQTVFEPLWELERGGMYVPPGEVVSSREDLEEIAYQMKLAMSPYHRFWWKANNYDSAFAQSARTVGKVLEREVGKHNAVMKTGRPNMVPISFKEYKQLAIKYTRLLLKNASRWDGNDSDLPTRALAISRKAVLLDEQLQTVQQKETNPDLTEKKNDDAVDSLLAGVTPLAKRHRHIITELEKTAEGRASLQPPKANDEVPDLMEGQAA